MKLLAYILGIFGICAGLYSMNQFNRLTDAGSMMISASGVPVEKSQWKKEVPKTDIDCDGKNRSC
jgi:hypothetical protein